MILSDALGEERARRFYEDPVKFVEAFDRRPYDYQAEDLASTLRRNADGKFEKPIAVISYPRQNGKTTLASWACLYRLYVEAEMEIISVANDRAQAGIIFRDAQKIIQGSETLKSLVDPEWGFTKSEIRLQNGNRWLVKSADAVLSRGMRPSTLSFDELGWAPSRDLFDALSSAQAAQLNPLLLVTSTVGPVKAGPLWDLFEMHRASDPDVRLIYRTENLSPRISTAFLERERRLKPPGEFAREHQNLWGEGSDVFCTEADWKRAVEDDPTRKDDPGPCLGFVDLGWVHDETVLAVGRRMPDGKAGILWMETFRGSQSAPVEFSKVEAKIIELSQTYKVRRWEIESPQGVGLSQSLKSSGVHAEIVYPTAQRQREMWGAFYKCLKAGACALPNDARLRQQLLTLTIQNSAAGWRVEDVPSIHQDRALACAGVVKMIESGMVRPLPEQEEVPSRWNLDVSRELGWAKKY